MFKFEIGDRVRKIKGYHYDGVILARYVTGEGNRYDVQVNGSNMIAPIEALGAKYGIDEAGMGLIHSINQRCNGMIHIFAEEQLEKYEISL